MSDLIYAYADESGDTGYQFDAASSPRFVLGIVIAEQPEQMIDKLLALRRKLGRPTTHKFHYRLTDAIERRAFFETVQYEPIRVFAAVIHKQHAPRDFRKQGKLGLYSHAIAGLCLRASIEFKHCKLLLDGGSKQKQFIDQLKSSVRWARRVANRPEQSFQNIRMLDSGNPLIQCADMITGAAAEQAEKGASKWMDMLAPSVSLVWHERFDDDR